MVFLSVVLGLLVALVVAATVYRFRLGASRASESALALAKIQQHGFVVHNNLLNLDPSVIVERPGSLRATTLTSLQLGMLKFDRVLVIETKLHAADQVVCTRANVQTALGAFPPNPQLTGDAAFDQEFGVFLGPGATNAPQPWAQPSVLATLRARHFVAMRVTNGVAQIAFTSPNPSGIIEAVLAVELMQRAAQGEAVAPRIRPWRPYSTGGLGWAIFTAGISLLIVLPTTISGVLTQAENGPPVLSSLSDNIFCSPGEHYIAVRQRRYYSQYCVNDTTNARRLLTSYQNGDDDRLVFYRMWAGLCAFVWILAVVVASMAAQARKQVQQWRETREVFEGEASQPASAHYR